MSIVYVSTPYKKKKPEIFISFALAHQKYAQSLNTHYAYHYKLAQIAIVQNVIFLMTEAKD